MTTKQGRGVTQAVAFDAATVGGAWVGVWGSIGELGAHYMCEVRFGSVLRSQLGVKKTTLLPITKIYYEGQSALLALTRPEHLLVELATNDGSIYYR